MKTLYESLLDDFDELDKDVHQNAKKSIIQFLIDNYILDGRPIKLDTKKIKINDKPNKDGKYVVDVDGSLMVYKYDINSLTNNIFVFGKVGGYFKYFNCAGCKNLTSLEGAPKEVSGYFGCDLCKNLTSLEGAPKKVGGHFYCIDCKNLTTLKGAPKEVGEDFDCSRCEKLTSLEGAPEEVEGRFDCSRCEKLTSLKGAPEKVGGDFELSGCIKLKNLDYLPEEIGGSLYVPSHLKK